MKFSTRALASLGILLLVTCLVLQLWFLDVISIIVNTKPVDVQNIKVQVSVGSYAKYENSRHKKHNPVLQAGEKSTFLPNFSSANMFPQADNKNHKKLLTNELSLGTSPLTTSSGKVSEKLIKILKKRPVATEKSKRSQRTTPMSNSTKTNELSQATTASKTSTKPATETLTTAPKTDTPLKSSKPPTSTIIPLTTEAGLATVSPTPTQESKCFYERLPFKHAIPQEAITCKPHKISETACEYVQKEFKYDFEKQTCGNKETFSICKFDRNKVRFKCNYHSCGTDYRSEIFVHTFNDENGKVEIRKPGFRNMSELERAMLKQAHQQNLGQDFMFVSCGESVNKTQLVAFDSTLFKEIKPRGEAEININIVWFDSISRDHFFRSLPKTISYLKQVNTDSSLEAEIFDFELFQSVHGHTRENMHAFLIGKTMPRNMTEDERKEVPPGIEEMLKFAKDNGYKTLYQEDMCWEGTWGLMDDLDAGENWTTLYKAIQSRSNIDDIGLTFSTCKMIEQIDAENLHIFNTDKQICYNGINMNTYLMDHVTRKLQNTKSNLFGFTALNIAHDPDGQRVQGIDADLAIFMENMTKADNTITIFLSDHGNTYTWYVYKHIDGRYEMYHPQLFVIVPESVQKKLGAQVMDALRKNQKRLFNLIDIHHTVKYLVDSKHSNMGILKELPSNRTCSDIPLSTPNLCLCEGWNSPVENKTEYWPFVEYAVGHINNIISDSSPMMKCNRLVPTGFENVLYKSNNDIVYLTFDVLTEPGPGSENEEEKVSLQVRYQVTKNLETFNATFASFERISKYGKYKRCSDAGTLFKLCVCDMNDKEKTRKPKQLTFVDLSAARNEYVYSINREDLNVHEGVTNLIDGHLGILERRTYEKEDEEDLVSVSFEMINTSSNQTYRMAVEFKALDNMKPLSVEECTATAKPNSMRYLCTIGRIRSAEDANFEIKVDYSITQS